MIALEDLNELWIKHEIVSSFGIELQQLNCIISCNILSTSKLLHFLPFLPFIFLHFPGCTCQKKIKMVVVVPLFVIISISLNWSALIPPVYVKSSFSLKLMPSTRLLQKHRRLSVAASQIWLQKCQSLFRPEKMKQTDLFMQCNGVKVFSDITDVIRVWVCTEWDALHHDFNCQIWNWVKFSLIVL